MNLSEKQEKEADFSKGFQINKCTKQKGTISFLCPECEHNYKLQTSLFDSEDNARKSGIVPTGGMVTYSPSSIQAIVLGGLIASPLILITLGILERWARFVSVVIWYISYKVYRLIRTKTLSLWMTNCNNCQESIHIGSDGKIYAIVTPSIETKGSEETDTVTNQCDECQKFFPQYELKPHAGRRLCLDCRKIAYSQGG